MSMVVLLATAVAVIGIWVLVSEVRKKYVTVWLGSYWRQQLRPRYAPLPGEHTHILFCLVDHFEPAGEPTRLHSTFVNGIKHLPVRVRPK